MRRSRTARRSLRWSSGRCREPGPGEVLIKVAAAGVNRPDILQRRGLYPPPPGAPDILGLEIAGTVVEAGEGAGRPDRQARSARWSRAAAMPNIASRRPGPACRCPKCCRMAEAAAMPETLFTVWVNLFERGFAADGDYGAGPRRDQRHRDDGDRARHICSGSKVIVTCGSDEKCAARDRAGRRRGDQLSDAGLRRGGQAADRAARASRSCSTWSAATMFRATSPAWPTRGGTSRSPSSAAPRPELPIPDIMRRRLTLTGSTLRPRSVEFKTMVADEIAGRSGPMSRAGG